MLITIDNDKCKKDNICIDECPFKLISLGKDGFPTMRRAGARVCIKCGHCVAVCPHNALTLEEIAQDGCEAVDSSLAISQEQASHFLKARRSIRNYKSKEVPREVLELILDSVRFAPSSKNTQPVHWTVVSGVEKVQEISALGVEWLREAGHMPGLTKAFDKGQDMLLNHAPHLFVAHTSPEKTGKPVEDTSIAMTYLDLAAYSVGVGTCWAGILMGIAGNHRAIADALNIPEDHQIYGAMMVGYPKIKYKFIPPRDEAKVEWID
ncbi:MAG: nitroreductase family protein [Desulfovibrio sp.]